MRDTAVEADGRYWARREAGERFQARYEAERTAPEVIDLRTVEVIALEELVS